MRILSRLMVILSLLVLPMGIAMGANNTAKPHVRLQTNLGNIKLVLYPKKAPKTVKNFLKYVKSGFYDGTIFHRVVPGFVIQGGGYTRDYQLKKTRAPIPDEADNGLENKRGTIAMARTSDPDSATSQFFINLADNHYLNHGVRGAGYAVFGRVTKGMKVVKRIADIPTGRKGPFPRNVPKKRVVIQKATVLKEDK